MAAWKSYAGGGRPADKDRRSMPAAAVLVALILLPLVLIVAQLAAGVSGALCYSIYKIGFIVPPLLYCRVYGVGIVADIIRPSNWRRGLRNCCLLGLLAVLIFWGAYYTLGDLLLDKQMIAAKIDRQFSVNSRTVFLVAPFTIVLNSFLEEFFYRGFAFGLLVRRRRLLGWLLPAAAFTTQHLLFIYHWVTALPFAMAVVGLLVFALVLQRVYEATETLIAPWLIHIFGDVAMMGIAVTLLLWGV